MIPSLMAGLNEKNVQAVVDKFNLKCYNNIIKRKREVK